MDGELRIFLLMGAAAIAGAALGYVLMSNGWRRAFVAIFAGHVLAAIGMVVAVSQLSGMDGMGYAVMLIVFVFPSMLGMGVSGAVTLWRGRS
jgi:hypothetical protein